jgi:hypothetical protein
MPPNAAEAAEVMVAIAKSDDRMGIPVARHPTPGFRITRVIRHPATDQEKISIKKW